MRENKRITVFSLKVANQLVNEGFLLLGTGVNLKYPQYKVFFFNDIPEIRERISSLNKK